MWLDVELFGGDLHSVAARRRLNDPADAVVTVTIENFAVHDDATGCNIVIYST